MREINIAKNITALRRERQVTQEQMAVSIGVTAQAVSKWEKGICLPDAMTLPLIADYFNVSIDYLYFGGDYAYDDLYGQNFKKVASYAHYSKDSFDTAMKIVSSAHFGIAGGNLGSYDSKYDEPSHIGNENGFSLLSGKGFGAMVMREFFDTVDDKAIEFSSKFVKILSEDNCILTVAAVISMSGISFGELTEKTGLDSDAQRLAVEALVAAGVLEEKESKHRMLGMTYTVKAIYHTCLCLLLATLSMQWMSFRRISCCMGYGDYPMRIGSDSMR